MSASALFDLSPKAQGLYNVLKEFCEVGIQRFLGS